MRGGREEKEYAVAVDAERAKQGHAPRRRAAQKLWYARYHFWREAERLFEGRDEALRNISDLSPEDRENCLLKTHEYFSRHPAFQMRGRGSGFVLLGNGPTLDADCPQETSTTFLKHFQNNPCLSFVLYFFIDFSAFRNSAVVTG